MGQRDDVFGRPSIVYRVPIRQPRVRGLSSLVDGFVMQKMLLILLLFIYC